MIWVILTRNQGSTDRERTKRARPESDKLNFWKRGWQRTRTSEVRGWLSESWFLKKLWENYGSWLILKPVEYDAKTVFDFKNAKGCKLSIYMWAVPGFERIVIKIHVKALVQSSSGQIWVNPIWVLSKLTMIFPTMWVSTVGSSITSW